MRNVVSSMAIVTLALSCNGGQSDGSTTLPMTSLGATSLGMTSTATEDEVVDDDTSEPKLDANGGTMGDNGIDTGDDGCTKVDLLFVIDNSGSMADEQANLIASFPGFISAMQQELAETDGYHVGVVTSDTYIFDLGCSPLEVGNLVGRTGGTDSSNGVCTPYASGLNYMTEQDDLADKFSCAAQVGSGGDGDEHPMEAMLTALSSPLIDAGSCNEGFLRDDALLVVVIITDEEDDHETQAEACDMTALPGSPGEPATWFDDLVEVKGEEGNVVVLSLVGPDAEAGNMCPALDKCNGGIVGAEVADRILEFTRMFTFGFIGPVCDDFGPIFAESIAVIATACEEFNPIG